MAPFQVTNTQARRITIAGQDIDPGRLSKPIQVLFTTGENKGKVDQEATEALVAKVKASPVFRGGWLKEGAVMMPPPAQVVKPPTLVALDDTKALAYVKVEDDLAILAAWAEAENAAGRRKVILDAIGVRAGQITAAKV